MKSVFIKSSQNSELFGLHLNYVGFHQVRHILFIITAAIIVHAGQVVAFQTGLIQGEVRANGEPQAGVYIRLNDTKATVSDKDGLFSFENVPYGNHQLKASSLGFKDQSVEVYLSKAEIQVVIQLEEEVIQGKDIVVTATRSQRDIEDVPLPVTVIPKEEINSGGFTQMDEILSEQTGINVVNFLGAGVQLQGLDPDYTLILIDGQPVIGRSGGVLDLNRINAGNIEQVEVVKGPSSSLWGSDALAGVINVITKKSSDPFSLDVYGRLGEFTSFDAGLNGAFNSRRVSTNFFINTNGATGRVADPGENNDDPTTQNYSASITNKIELASFADLNVTGRMFYEGNNSTFEFSETIDDRSLTDNVGNENTQRDLSFNSILALRPSGKSRVNLDYYFSQFRTENLYDTEIPEFRDILLEDTFNQYYQKLETNSNYYWNNNHITSAGVGSTFERLRADRYPDNPSFNTQFVFAQHEWQIFPALAFTGGMRWDNHSEFESRFTPKGSLLLKVNDELRLRASVGTGFRSPDFRQLFLDFSNPVAGYSVFGSSNVDIGVQRLDELGLIRRIISDPTGLDPLVPEASVAFNGGFDYFINEFSTIRFNLFRNNVNNLIETLPIAERTSRQFVFTYFNLENVVTQGFDVDIRTRLSDQVQLSLGYQYLDATQEVEFDRTILDSNGAPVTVTQTSNLTLPNRSTHSGNMKFVFNESLTGIQANYRVVFNGVFNVGDVNGNNRIDSSEELPDQELRFLGLSSLTITDSVPGYLIHDVTLGKQFGNYLVQAGIDNMFNFQNFRFVPGQLGRVMYLRFSTKIF